MKNTLLFLDSNFLLLPTQNKLDIYEEFRYVVPQPYKIIVSSLVFGELDHKFSILEARNKTKFQREYNFAKQILERNEYTRLDEVYKKGLPVDDQILAQALNCKNKGYDVYIATNDKEFKGKCKKNHVPVVVMRQKKKLEIEST